jgi:para-nitrobenzyl esterase
MLLKHCKAVLLVCVITTSLSENGDNSFLKLELKSGWIQGRLEKTPAGNTGRAFQGIPYAQPPIKSLRFKQPLPSFSWNGIKNTTSYPPSCKQGKNLGNPYLPPEQSEDCLYVNVFAPVPTDSSEVFPVVFYIHGGQFDYDSVHMFSPRILVDNFVAHKVVFVLPAFRLQVFGKWSTYTEDSMTNNFIRGETFLN